ncbi:MAG: hypothetical protein ABFD60_04250 [Bryobacteraceae bacterium]
MDSQTQNAFELLFFNAALRGISRRYTRDAATLMSFAEAVATNVQQTGNTALLVECAGLLGQVTELLTSLDPRRWSLATLFRVGDPFKPVRLEADRIARTYGLDWKR